MKILQSVKRKAYRLDLQLSLCGLRIGWAGIIGLIPWIGDVIAALLAMQLLSKADKIEGGLPPKLKAKMKRNIAADFGIGLIPVVGDFINVLYKCNLRNFVLLEQYLVEKYSGDTKHQVKEPTRAAKVPPTPPPRDVPATENQKSGIYTYDPDRANMV